MAAKTFHVVIAQIVKVFHIQYTKYTPDALRKPDLTSVHTNNQA